MDDQFMFSGLRKPRPEFARRLSERLDRLESEPTRLHRPRPAARAALYAASLVLAVGLFAFPSVRAGARAFLDLFRVVNFAPVAVQPDRIKALIAQRQIRLPQLLGEQVEVLKAPAPPQTVATPEAAGAAAGIRVRMPAWRPVGMEPELIEVSADHALRVTANAANLRSLLDALGIDDLRVPDEIDGQSATVRVPAVVRITYRDQARFATLLQARQPEVSFPAGIDLAGLAEIGLRVLGIERTEAHRFAQNVDWRTTLMVPVPADVSAFRQVDVQGHAGLLIESARRSSQGAGGPETSILWSSGDTIFALVGNVRSAELFEMAQSVQ
jgi:hypothetical protein